MGGRQEQNPRARNPGAWEPRRDYITPETGHDAYRARKHLPEPTLCPSCEAVFHDGHWAWAATRPAGANEELCPACQRVRDRFPAGFLSLAGPFFEQHRTEILNLADNEAVAETAEHALHRVIDRQPEGEGVLITTTDIHLPRRIGEAIERAYSGVFEYRYLEDDTILRASWRR